MRVLHIGKYFPPYRGGMETYLRDLMVTQAKQGLETAALVHRTEISLTHIKECVAESGVALTVHRAAVWLRLLFTPISPLFPWLLARVIRDSHTDVLHIHLPNISATWALLVPAARKLPWVVHWHSDIPLAAESRSLAFFYRLYRPFERAILARSSAIIATSPPYLESSIPLSPFRNKCQVVPLGLKSRDIQVSPITKDTPLRVLAVGRLTYYKGFEYLVRAMAQCEGATLALAGTGDCEHSLQSLAHELGLSERISFHGEVSDDELDTLYNNCHCLCLPSIERTEAFGMVLLEAMQRGRASIVTKVPGSGMTWVIDEGITGLHASTRDATALAGAIQELAEQRTRLEQMGSAARQKFEREFRIEWSAQEITRIYQNVL